MARIGGKGRMKRSKAPSFWNIHRKEYRFTVVPSPGPHPRSECYPMLVLLRDILGLARTAREAEACIKQGEVLLDGTRRKNPRFPVGLMDVVEIPSTMKAYRMVPRNGKPLMPP